MHSHRLMARITWSCLIVLILVVMEDALAQTYFFGLSDGCLVLILVVMEDALALTINF